MRRCFDLSTPPPPDKNYTDNPLPREQNKNKVSTIPPQPKPMDSFGLAPINAG